MKLRFWWRNGTTGIVIMGMILLAIPAGAQVPVALGPDPKIQFFSNSGAPLAGGFVYTFSAGTNSPLATYTDSTGLVANSNPILLDAAGRAAIWYQASAYKIVVKSSGGVTIFTTDNFVAAPFTSGNNSWVGNNTFSGTTTFSGPARLNGGGNLSGTFGGNATFSGTTNFANAVFSGGETFTAGLLTDLITGITPSSLMTITGAAGVGLGATEGITISTSGGLHGSGGIALLPGNGGSGGGGDLNLFSGGSGTGAPGSIFIQSATAFSSFNQGGDITITSGNGFGARGGNITFNGGSGGANSIVFNPAATGTISFNQSVNSDASAFKHIVSPLTGTCPTGAGVGNVCTSANISWITPFADNNYTLVCSLESIVNVPTIVVATKLAAGAGFTVTIGALTAAAANGSVDCIGVHN